MRVRDIMKTKVYTVAPSEPVLTVADRFRNNRVHHLVVARGSTILGLVTDHDLDRALERGADQSPVGDVMTENVITIEPEATVREAANKMRGRTIGCLPVVKEQKLVGIITTSDLVDLIGRGAMIPIRKGERREIRSNRNGRRV